MEHKGQPLSVCDRVRVSQEFQNNVRIRLRIFKKLADVRRLRERVSTSQTSDLHGTTTSGKLDSGVHVRVVLSAPRGAAPDGRKF